MDFGESRGNRPRGGRGPIPVKEGDTYDVEIEGIGEKGDGIAKVNGYVIIVPGVKKGDMVKVRVNAVRGKVSFGEVIGEATAGTGESDDGKELSEPSENAEDMDGEDSADEDVEEPEEKTEEEE